MQYYTVISPEYFSCSNSKRPIQMHCYLSRCVFAPILSTKPSAKKRIRHLTDTISTLLAEVRLMGYSSCRPASHELDTPGCAIRWDHERVRCRRQKYLELGKLVNFILSFVAYSDLRTAITPPREGTIAAADDDP